MTLLLTHAETRSLRRMTKALDVDKKGLALSVLLGVIGLGSSIALAATAAWLIARASQHPPVMWLTLAATAVRLFGVLRALMRYLQRLASHKVALLGMDALRLHAYTRLAHARIDRVAALQRGDLLARTGADIDAVGDFVVKSLLPAVVAAIVALGTVVGFAVISPVAALILAACLFVSAVVAPIVTMHSARLAEQETGAARVQLADGVVTIMEGASELAITGKLALARAQIEAAENSLHRAISRSGVIAGIAAGIDRLAMGTAVLGAMLIGIPDTSNGVMLAVFLAVITLTPLSAFEGSAEMAPAAVQLLRSAQAAQRIDALLSDDQDDAALLPMPDEALRAPSCIEVRDCTIGWPGGTPLVEGLSFDVTMGDRLAIIGSSGIGKTTLLLTLAGVLPPLSGSVTLNGVDMWATRRDQVTEHVTMTAEDAHIFASTVFENLRVANPNLTREEAEDLLEKVGLHAWLRGLPSGLDTLLGSGGTTVSGGERRRLLMARALAAPSPLILADEASEHLDASTADSLMETLFDQARGGERGVVIVSHRLSALDQADRILMLGRTDPDQPARIVAQGTHEELLTEIDTYRWAYEQEQ